MKPKESDWKKFKNSLDKWRERYLRWKNDEIRSMLEDENRDDSLVDDRELTGQASLRGDATVGGGRPLARLRPLLLSLFRHRAEPYRRW